MDRSDFKRFTWHEVDDEFVFELLKLTQHPVRVFTRSALLREVWSPTSTGGPRKVDVYIKLRAKLGPEHEHLIETVRGVGYRAAEVTAE